MAPSLAMTSKWWSHTRTSGRGRARANRSVCVWTNTGFVQFASQVARAKDIRVFVRERRYPVDDQYCDGHPIPGYGGYLLEQNRDHEYSGDLRKQEMEFSHTFAFSGSGIRLASTAS